MCNLQCVRDNIVIGLQSKMPVTGLFFLPNTSPDSSPARSLISRLNEVYEAIPQPPWSLSCRLFRETPSSAQSSQTSSSLDGKPTSQRILQILSLSHHAPRTYVAITTTHASQHTKVGTPASSQQSSEAVVSGEPATVISIPVGGVTEEFTQLVASKFGPLWQPRLALHVINGATFEVGDFKIRVGEVKQGYGGGTQTARGAVCEIEWTAAEGVRQGSPAKNEGEAWNSAEPIIREFWGALEVKGAREVMLVPGIGDGDGSVRQWCEILRIRSQ